MGLASELGTEVTGYIMNFLIQIASNVTSAFLRLFGRKPKKSLPPPEQVTAMVRNPPVNRQLASPEPCGVFFGAKGGQFVVKPEETGGHVLV
jgi:hypothetical protein